MMPSEMHECTSCGSMYTSPLAAALCCDPELEQP